MSSCITDIKVIHKFLALTGGNWRNSIYVKCKECKYEPHEGCGDFLCALDENGTPVMLPVCDCKILFTPYIDPSDCLLWMGHLRFQEIYNAWIRHKRTELDKCPFITTQITI